VVQDKNRISESYWPALFKYAPDFQANQLVSALAVKLFLP